jgi:polygalacturonase
MTNNVVFNQDDAVAVTSGGDIVWDNSYCYGGHGASVGSVGLKSNNTVDGVIFSNTKIIASQNGARIKTNSGASGLVNNVTYSNIDVQDISIYGVSHPLGASRQMLMSLFLSGSLTFSKTTVSDN